MSDARPAVGVISNPRSGHNRDHFEGIRQRIERTPGVHHIVTESAAQIPAALAEMAARDVGVLAINGGDGTCSAVLGEMLENPPFERAPVIVLLPAGTANMNAGDVGVRGSLKKAVDRFCNWCEGSREAGSYQRRSLIRVDAGPGEPPRYGMFLGAGAIIQGTDYAHQQLHSRGLRDDFSLALGTARTAWGVLRNDPRFRQPVAVEISLGGEPRRFDMLILAISSLQRLAFGMRPFWGEGAAALGVTLIESRCSRFATTFVSILRGRANRNATPAAGYHSWRVERLRMDVAGKLNLDGEILAPTGPVEVSASPALEFLRL